MRRQTHERVCIGRANYAAQTLVLLSSWVLLGLRELAMTDEEFRTLVTYLRSIVVILGVMTGMLGVLIWGYLWLAS